MVTTLVTRSANERAILRSSLPIQYSSRDFGARPLLALLEPRVDLRARSQMEPCEEMVVLGIAHLGIVLSVYPPMR
jgi:hypothetical protein